MDGLQLHVLGRLRLGHEEEDQGDRFQGLGLHVLQQLVVYPRPHRCFRLDRGLGC